MNDFNPFNVPEFRKELSDMLDTKLTPLAVKVEKHEAILNQSKGVVALLIIIWTGLVGLAEVLFHSKSKG